MASLQMRAHSAGSQLHSCTYPGRMDSAPRVVALNLTPVASAAGVFLCPKSMG
jgi:hypothetical protein